MAIEKGSKEFEFWADIYRYKSKFTPPQDTADYFAQLTAEGKELRDKYVGDAILFTLAQNILIDIWNVLDVEVMNKRGRMTTK